MRQLAILIASLAVLAGRSGTTDGKQVTREDYGDAWPLTVDKATLRCHSGDQATVEAEGTEY